MNRFIVVTQSEASRQELLALSEPFKTQRRVEEAATLTEVTRRISGTEEVAVLYGTDWLSDVEAGRVSNFRVQCPHIPVIVIAQSDTVSALETIRMIPWVLFIERPYSVTFAQHLISRLLDHKDMRQAMYRRYSTDTKGWLEQGLRRVPVSVANVSLGGACCVLPVDENWPAGSHVTLRLVLNELGRERVMSAYVVWSREDQETGRRLVGLKFKAAS